MQTSWRDNAVAKNRLILKLTLLWAMSSSVAVIVLTALCYYALEHRQTHWLPVCAGGEFIIGNSDYSPEYLKKMTEKVADLRLTYNPETIESRNTTLIHLIPANHQEAFKQLLDAERETVIKKNISSVFYAEHVTVDIKSHQGQINGLLYRTSHGLQLSPKHKTYNLQFSFNNGLLGLESVKEISNAR